MPNLIESWFQPLGFILHLKSNTPKIIAAAQASFGGFGAVPPNSPAAFTFELFEHDLDDGQLGQPIFRTAGDLVYQTTGRDSTVVVNRAEGFAYGYFSRTTLANPAFFRWHFLELACFVMLARRGIMGVHGAAVVKRGRAILLRAASGGGKTTLAYAAARSHFQALAEDVVWLAVNRSDAPTNGPRWWGMPWSFHLLPDAKRLFPELAAYQPILQTNGEHKLEVNLETIRPGSTTTTALPGPVVLVQRCPGQQSSLEPLPFDKAKPLWMAGQAGDETGFPNYHDHIDSLLTHQAYRLRFGDDIEQAVDLLDELV